MDNVRRTETKGWLACEACFEDANLRSVIRDMGQKGDCGWCGSTDQLVVELDVLGLWFRDAARIYEEVGAEDGGDSLFYLFQEDWSVFSELLNEAGEDRAERLFDSIMVAGLHPKDDVDEPNYCGFFQRTKSRLDSYWLEYIRSQILEANSHSSVDANLAESNVAHDIWADSIESSNAIKYAYEFLARRFNGELYRARIHQPRHRKDRFTRDEMGAPSPIDARAGRANREGESMLYVALDHDTALLEVRAWKGTVIALSKMKLRRAVRLIDLSSPRLPESPFESDLVWKMELGAFLYQLGNEMSRPLLQGEEHLYQATQYLCDHVKSAGYDGVLYRSAMGSGKNAVLFDTTLVEPDDPEYIHVEQFPLHSLKLTEHDGIYVESEFDMTLESIRANEFLIRLRVFATEGGGYLASSTDVPGLSAEGPTVCETVKCAQRSARSFVESCLRKGKPLPATLLDSRVTDKSIDLIIPIDLPKTI